ncbi:YqcC family protein [Marinomonas posidonica]|uniref:YqcC-like domain-containing protein n=1 Tax=Marinomonas posidonica (strain CECT 7376 / NCIMB 14433 / IVIA-Po-181) TaxID=491952 RepID=F6CT49_MARPP|nr:YqcC family protein [Marinomonas posidonica]AEF55107.1 protein of unknown function DUF446 [Marinomonas posidonica IVIA-Po-181]
MNQTFSGHHTLADLLIALQISLQDSGLWECEQPNHEALQSQQPFCIDTMSFEQWLRYVMIEKFKDLLQSGSALPNRCHISPMAEEAFKGDDSVDLSRIIECLDQIDQHLSGQ